MFFLNQHERNDKMRVLMFFFLIVFVTTTQAASTMSVQGSPSDCDEHKAYIDFLWESVRAVGAFCTKNPGSLDGLYATALRENPGAQLTEFRDVKHLTREGRKLMWEEVNSYHENCPDGLPVQKEISDFIRTGRFPSSEAAQENSLPMLGVKLYQIHEIPSEPFDDKQEQLIFSFGEPNHDIHDSLFAEDNDGSFYFSPIVIDQSDSYVSLGVDGGIDNVNRGLLSIGIMALGGAAVYGLYAVSGSSSSLLYLMSEEEMQKEESPHYDLYDQ
jgi:hypothetical protein